MLATQVLPEDLSDNASKDESEVVGHLFIEGLRHEIRRGETRIGRDLACSVTLENCSVSKFHAVIESDGRDETFIYDCGSTNLTKLGKKKLRPHCRYKLDDGTVLVLGNVVATFKLAPERNSPETKTRKTISANTQALDELDDIFDLPTQVTVSGPRISRGNPEFSNDIKITNSVIYNNKGDAPSDGKDSELSVLENSNIFNLSTQSQLPRPTHCGKDESEKVKCLLNDGQDDVLCDFMSLRSPRCVDEMEIDIFDAPTQIYTVGACGSENVKDTRSESILEVCSDQEEEVLTQTFDEVTKKDGEIRSGDDNVIFTQKFELVNDQADESVLEMSLGDQNEDSIVTQKFEDAARQNRAEATGEGKNDEDRTSQPRSGFKDLIHTHNYQSGLVEYSERIESIFSKCLKCNEKKSAENSGDETESDLEIDKDKSFAIEQIKTPPEPQMNESRNSNDSYTFEIHAEPEATDCKTETEPETAFEEIPSPPVNVQLDIPTERRSLSPACWSQLSLEMPSTQDVESAVNKVLERENLVENELEQTDSPAKRSRDSSVSVDVSVIKKQKTDRGLSKLWQVHDIAQIQPTRTRNSLGTPDINKQPCRKSTRGRKSKPDITPYLIRCREKKETPKENTTVLRRRKSARFETPARKRGTKTDSPVVAFTGFKNASLEKSIHELGGKKTNDLSSASVVVANKVRRTVKFLCAIGLSLPITSPQWLSTSKKEKKFVNPLNFILKDEEAEEKWEFDLRQSLERSKRVKLLEGYSVFATKNTKPPVKDLLAIVECCGGTPIVHRPTIWPRKTIIVSCEEDEGAWPPPKVRNIKLVHYEFILTGVLRQKIDFKSYSLR